MLQSVGCGQIIMHPFIFGDGSPMDGKPRPVVVMRTNCCGKLLLMPLSSDPNYRRDGHLIVPVTCRDMAQLWPNFVDGVAVVHPYLSCLKKAELLGRLCQRKVGEIIQTAQGAGLLKNILH